MIHLEAAHEAGTVFVQIDVQDGQILGGQGALAHPAEGPEHQVFGVGLDEQLRPRLVDRVDEQVGDSGLQPRMQVHLRLFDDHHQFRVIPMTPPRPVGSDIKTWNGLAHGRWDGNTLVIETTNLNGDTWIDDSGNFYTDGAKATERLTMLDADTIHYALTLEDANVYTRPWTIAWALVRVTEPGFELIEEACREGERTVGDLHQRGLKYYFGAPWRSRVTVTFR